MDVVESWTGRHAVALQKALRKSNEAFAQDLGIATRTVASWHARSDVVLTPVNQEALDTVLQGVTAGVHRLFIRILQGRHDATSLLDSGPSTVANLDLVVAGEPRVEPAPFSLEIAAIDAGVVSLLKDQTNNYRMLDRRFGAAVLPQAKAHVRHIESLLRNSLPNEFQREAAVALAEAAALAGWQALDAGERAVCWEFHDIAKSAARLGGDVATLAHVTAQQAYVLLDVGRGADALQLVQHANSSENRKKCPPRLRAWLLAAEAEFVASLGEESETRRLMDRSFAALPDGDADPEFPYLMLNTANLQRWQGNCLAALGADEAVEHLYSALDSIEGNQSTESSRRSQASLQIDLATALYERGDVAGSQNHAARAAELAGHTGSARQRARIQRLLGVLTGTWAA